MRRHAQHGGITEVRLIQDRPTRSVWSGYFDAQHAEQLVNLLAPVARPKVPYGEHPRIGEANVYATLQPVNPDLLARCANAFSRCPAASDHDIVAYDLLGVDVDAVRPAGISSTAAEKEAARTAAEEVANWLMERGVRPICADSGNGYHLLAPTMPYTDVEQAAENARDLLRILDEKFSTSSAKVDTTLYTASHLLRLYGTKSMKGSSTTDRPHRYSFIELPKTIDDVDLFELLEADLARYRTVRPPTNRLDAKSKQHKTAGATVVKPSRHLAGGAAVEGWDAETSRAVLTAIMDRAGYEYRVKEKQGDLFFEFDDCPHHTDPDGHHYECCVIVRADGSYAAKCQHDDDAGWENFKPLINWQENIRGVLDDLDVRRVEQYRATPYGIVLRKPKGNSSTEVPLTNFNAVILRDVVFNDGLEKRHAFEIEAQLFDRRERVSVPSDQFAAMAWPLTHLGAGAVIHAGQGFRDHVRAAIQLLSGDVPTETSYTHTGWRLDNGRPLYLHGGGAIGPEGNAANVRVALSAPLDRFALPDPPRGTELIEAVHVTLRMLDIAHDTITMPLFASIWRAIAGDTDYALFLIGQSGAGKSELAALVQQHFGAGFDARHLPANWSSTANANEGIAFLAKDAVLVVDDFAPAGTEFEVQKMHREADRLLRGQGNSAGRGRMRPDATLRPSKPPRGMILSTGEEPPRGQSLRARMLLIDVPRNSINWDKVTLCQTDAKDGKYAAATAGFVRWFAGQYDSIHRDMLTKLAELRRDATKSNQHKRTPTIIANLQYGTCLFTDFAVEVGALTKQDAEDLRRRAWEALGELAKAQRQAHRESDPVERFIAALNAALVSGRAHVATPKGTSPATNAESYGWRMDRNYEQQPQGDCIGWVEGSDLYIEPEAAYRVAQQYTGGEALPGSKTLHKRLRERDKLASTDTTRKRNLIRKSFGGRTIEVLHMRTAVLGADSENQKK